MSALEIPACFGFLFEPHRYKVAYGGRGAGKTRSFCRAMLVKGKAKRKRFLCAREIQNSIKDSVHKTLADEVVRLGMQDFYDVKANSIVGRNGTEFMFEGLRHNVDSIRSKEGIDIAAVFEAKNVSKASWEVLIPTVREDGSEIWVEFNPELETDETYRRFVTKPPHDDADPGYAAVRKVSFRDNPWFPDVLKKELRDLKAQDEDAYLNVWEGQCRVTLHGAIYAQELRRATIDGRICRVPYDESQPVHTFWDLGWSDCTSIWFAQKVGFEYRLVDFYQNRLQKLAHYLGVLQERRYLYGTHYLPHDADNESLGSKSIAQTMRDMQYRVSVVPRVQDKANGLKATREIFGRCWFDSEKCADGLQALRHYRYDVDEHGQFSKQPLHDENSHGADAFETFARSIDRRVQVKEAPVIEIVGAYDKEAASVQWLAT